ncbi:nonribosomal peptide synthetase [Dothideomycetidae sp. 11243]|nr:nonribosomal peptide synthetase [fungal sp. No.11243]
MLQHLDHVVQQLLGKDAAERTLGSVALASEWDLAQARRWNNADITPVNACVHTLIEKTAAKTPQQEAVVSTEVTLTYEQLDQLSSSLASVLAQKGVQAETMVACCMEKSAWAIVSMLAIMKAGGVYMPIDPAHPVERRRTLIESVGARYMLASPATMPTCFDLVEELIEVSADFMTKLQKESASPKKDELKIHATPSNAVYAIFTSGSTGKPKTIVVEHAALCTSIFGHGRSYGISDKSRVLQFSSFVFDVSIGEIFTILAFGGTVCVPTEEQRLHGTVDFINDNNVNTAFITPSFANTFQPQQVPSLSTLVLGGEAPTKESLKNWFGKVHLINGYGPAEAVVYCSTHVYDSVSESASTIGSCPNGHCWVVEPENHDLLAPIGCTGELMIQGHALARGYADDETTTAQSFLRNVAFLPSNSGDSARFYKTGDLVKYLPNGDLEYVGRRDTQAKIRGQRLDFAEIEHAVKSACEEVEHVAVDIIRKDAAETLVAFVQLEAGNTSGKRGELSEALIEMDEDSVRDTLTDLRSKLIQSLPRYMVPTLLLPVHWMPFGSSQKLDRKRLREMAQELSRERLLDFLLASQMRVEPTTEMEFRLRDIWAAVLKFAAEEIGKDDSFLQIGGDSISAIQLVSAARREGISLTVSTIFEDSRLSSMAATATDGVADDVDAAPFSLLPKGQEQLVKDGIMKQCSLDNEDYIEDAYPCTSLQEGLMALAEKQPGSYMAKYVYQIPEYIEESRFLNAWESTVQQCGNLHTRIVQVQGQTVQALIKNEGRAWEGAKDTSLKGAMEIAGSMKMRYGSRLCRYILTKEPTTGERHFVLIVHHAVFDGWSLNIVIDTLMRMYHQLDLPTMRPYSGFIKYVSGIDEDAARHYWTEQLDNAGKASYPPTARKDSSKKKATRTMKKILTFPSSTVDASVTKATVLRAAWAVVLAKYSDSEDVTFGTTVSGRQAPVSGIETMAGPGVATVPVRIRLQKNESVSDMLRNAQSQTLEMVPYEQYGLQKISRLSQAAQEACDFSSLFVIQPMQTLAGDADDDKTAVLKAPASDEYRDEESAEGYFTYPLVVQGFLYDDHVELSVIYDSNVLVQQQIEALTQHFDGAVQQLLTQNDASLDSIALTSEWDLKQAIEWNGTGPEVISSCVHELVEQQARRRPDAPAISAWDAEFTYSELNAVANRLAHHLVDSTGVRRGDLVHICFEKSAWFYVAMLAINKAGAAWVPLDPSHPEQRLQQLVSQTGATIAVSSQSNADRCAKLVDKVVVASADFDAELVATGEDKSAEAPVTGVTSTDAVYVLFTSGSTGLPKGLVMEHGSVCTSQTAIAERLRMTEDVRMLQFAAYVFDLCIGEIIAPLISGACLCVPSEHTRMNGLKDFMRERDVTWAFMTPAFARTMKPQELPGLELLLLAGEAVSRDVFDTWFGKVRFVNGWGPAETCVFSTLHEWQSADESPLTVGKPVGGYCWIVDPEDPSALAPTGCLGEVVIQGPTLLRGYLGDKERTAASTVATLPVWAPQQNSRHWSRFFKSGDLCRYNPDGTIEFSSRKDTQVKIRGLRVELGEVEHHVKTLLKDCQQVVVDVFKTDAGTNLAAYFCFTEETRTDADTTESEAFLPIDAEMKETLRAMAGELAVALPRYMVPSLFIPCKYMPSITSTKLDRKGLRNMTAALSQDQLASYALADGEKRAPITEMERRLQQAWATILGLPADTIGRDDSFLRIGGDSISAIRLVTLGRDSGIALSVQDIFDDPRLMAMAAKATEMDESVVEEITQPFALISEDEHAAVKTAIVEQCGLSSEQQIDDAYPCTGLQEGLMALAVKQPGSYMAKYAYRLPEHIDEQRFRKAWANTVQQCGNLRTRIALVNGRSLQTLVQDKGDWDIFGDGRQSGLRETMDATQGIEMKYGSRLCRYGLAEETDGQRHFVLVLHHAVFDGWSLNLIIDTLVRSYLETAVSALKPYAGFIKYTSSMDEDAAREYWTGQLQEARKASFPPASRGDQTMQTKTMRRTIDFPWSADSSITKATVLRTAWAVVLARYCETEDVCFGTTVSGRQASVAGVESMAGPAVATVPVRVRLDKNSSMADVLQGIQSQALAMVPFEQYGLQKISRLSEAAQDACDFGSLFVIQPMQTSAQEGEEAEKVLDTVTSEDYTAEAANEGYFTYPLVFQGFLYGDRVDLTLIFDSGVLSTERVEALTQHFETAVQQLLTNDKASLDSFNLASDWDLKTVAGWNAEVPDVKATCVHELVEQQALRRPDAPAISAWDGELSYKALNEAANRLAHHLIEAAGVTRGDLVHICFEKSKWFFVSMLAINKAGAAWVPLDPSHPEARLQQVISKTGAAVILASSSTGEKCGKLLPKTIVVTQELDSELAAADNSGLATRTPETGVSSSDAAYVLFTSGSTGVPKGLVMEHGSVCTSQSAIAERLGLTQDVRMLQFAAYVFDLCIGEIIAPLISGACLCVPSEHTRMNGLREFIAEQRINWAFLTPAFARTIKPTEVPSLELLLLAGEAVSRDILDTWFGHVRLINGWGPAETCVFSTLHEWQSKEESPLTVGRPVGGHCWIIDPEYPSKLAPVGCLGEVVIQGPTLLREYLGDAERTAASTVSTLPSWAAQRTPDNCWNRFFKSGDLCYYNMDGTIEFSSRKDTQVKIRGLRVELGEVEHHVRTALKDTRQVVVDVFNTNGGTNLAAYFCFSDDTRVIGADEDADSAQADTFLPITAELKDKLRAMAGSLAVALPSYMVPTLFVPCAYMPSITSTKLDRNTLKRLTCSLDQEQLEKYSLDDGEKRAPATDMETRLQQAWSSILNIPTQSIGRDDSFLRIGGDSISAIRLVTLARENGISLTVQDIFDDPRLMSMASKAEEVGEAAEENIEPFSLLAGNEDALKAAIVKQCGLDSVDDIEDAYPCTGLQEGLMALAVKQPGSYMAKYAYKLPVHVDEDKFRSAWEIAVESCGNLRTRIVVAEDKTVQALIRTHGTATWEAPEAGKTGNLRWAMATARDMKMQYGSQLCRYALTKEADGERHFVLVIHHAIFDGWSLNLVIDALVRAYRDLEMPVLRPYAGFIKYTTSIDQDEARDYWTNQLENVTRASFPSVSRAAANAEKITRTMKKEIAFPASTDASITKATILRAAWAIVLAQYSETDDICFGTTVSGRQAPVVGVESMAGPGVATLPVRIRLDKQKTVSQTLQEIQAQALEMVPYEQYGLQKISRLSKATQEACDFSSLFVIQPMQSFVDGGDDENAILAAVTSDEYKGEDAAEGYFTYPLVLQGFLFNDRIRLSLIYDASVLDERQIEALSQHFERVLNQLLSPQDDTLLDAVSLMGEWDLQQAMEWNSEEPELVTSCIHELVEQQAIARSEALAINAWDGQLTYGQLNAAANRLSHHLVHNFEMQRGALVHVCFEKSMWWFVAILAINKAGGAWVPLDPSHPAERLRQVADQTQAELALTSSANSKKCSSFVERVLVVDAQLDSDLLAADEDNKFSTTTPKTDVTSDDAAYVLFTSGSTGTPKGLVMEHGAVATSQTAIAARLGLTHEVRMLQFASFVFDLCIGEIIAPLITGATLCVPSDETRMNGLVDYIRDQDITWAYLTPAFARTLSPDQVPSLKLLLLAGEAVGRDVFDRWLGRVRLVNGWGPAETCVFSTLHEWTSATESPLTVGRPVGGHCWIVDADDHTKLVATGCLGEVMIQGPTLLREYLGDKERTAASSVLDLPVWTPNRQMRKWNRFFKSGDLCRYNADGTIEFSSRKDTQVKIRGLRVELGEVEHHVRQALDGARQIAVDVYTTDAGTNLAAYFCFDDDTKIVNADTEAMDVFQPISTELRDRLTAMAGRLSVKLPSYMVPTLFVPCSFMPSITSTKLDRGSLRRLTSELSQEQLSSYALSDGEKRTPATEMETRLQQAWAAILNLSTESIGRDDSFLRIGGDSISTIRLVTLARENGISLTVQDVFDDPRLMGMAEKATLLDGPIVDENIAPFGLLTDDEARIHELKSQTATQCGIKADAVEDAYPCTGLQEGLMALAVKQPGSYMAKYAYKLPEHVDELRFREAWEETLRTCSNLRTRIIALDGKTVQAVLDEEVRWEATEDGQEKGLRWAMDAANRMQMQYGSRLCRYGITRENSGEKHFVLVIHHSVFDGWALNVAMDALVRAYRGMEPPSIKPYSGFIKYANGIDEEAARGYCSSENHITRTIKKNISVPKTADSSVTKATILRAAWAIVLARYSETEDICFGAVVSGRQAPVSGVETMAGPAVATVPVRVRLDKTRSVHDTLHGVQDQALSMVPYEQFGLRNIAKLGAHAKEACDFSSLLVLQPLQHAGGNAEDEDAILTTANEDLFAADDAVEGYFTYPLVLLGSMYDDDRVELALTYHADVLAEAQLTAMMQHLEVVVAQLLDSGEKALGDVGLASEWDLARATEWNGTEVAPVQKFCVHELVSARARRTPDHEAVMSSDISFTYAELDRLSTRLAQQLCQMGVGIETPVACCFEKSAWALLAMLAIVKSGGVYVPIDPSHPAGRRQALIKSIDAHFMLVSLTTAESCEGMTDKIFTVSESAIDALMAEPSKQAVNKTAYKNAAYVIFTSGSTGTPKTITVEHQALCTSIVGHGRSCSLDNKSRTLQFSSFVFDVSLGEIFTTLVFGGTVCVPSEHQRLYDTAGFINEARINTAFLTPSFANTFTPEQVPTLKTLILGGEAPTKESMKTWYGRVELINGYGPAEAVIYCATHVYSAAEESSTTIGRCPNGQCWIVEPEDHNCLAPVGCIGELVIQGHALARGYANGTDATERAFLESTEWMPTVKHGSRFYKTGDLVRYLPDGKIEYVGRRDTQAKIRGQRLELGEIEHAIKTALPDVEHVAVDVVKREGSETLIACVQLVGTLEQALPRYMVPTVVLPMRSMPFSTAHKLDRKKLKEMVHSLSREQLLEFSLASQEKVEPTTDMEFKLRDVWALVLGMSADVIGKEDAFLSIGGDSISAIQLVTEARKQGVSITVSNIFQDSRLCSMADVAVELEGSDNASFDTPPFSLLAEGEQREIKTEIVKQCGLASIDDIEDAYPCSGFQEYSITLTKAQPGAYIGKMVFNIPQHVDLPRFKKAWEQTLDVCANLRTRILSINGKAIQTVVPEPVVWESTDGMTLRETVDAAKAMRMQFNDRLCRYALVEESNGDRHFVLVLHHSLFDGWSLNLVMTTLFRAYEAMPLPTPTPYSGFINYTQTLDTSASEKYWTQHLSGAQKSCFPATKHTPSPTHRDVTRLLRTDIPLSQRSDSAITRATILRAAWALVLSHRCATRDICFGATVAGRYAPVSGLETMPGPALATLPVRIKWSPDMSVDEFLAAVQTQAAEEVKHEQMGMLKIKNLSDTTREEFASETETGQEAILEQSFSEDFTEEDELNDYWVYPLVVECMVMADKVELLLTYDSEAVGEEELKGLSAEFRDVVAQLVDGGDMPLGKIRVDGMAERV